MGNNGAAEPPYRQAVEVHRRVLGEQHPDFGASNNLAELYRVMGDPEAAPPLARQALEVWQATLGEAHPRFAAGLNNLANRFHGLGRYAQALPLYERVRAIREGAPGPDHADVAASLNNLANLRHDLGRDGDLSARHPLTQGAPDRTWNPLWSLGCPPSPEKNIPSRSKKPAGDTHIVCDNYSLS
jgi:tetratricopeptide (TPR) repeat protein